jgi:two-component system, cell cycle response regulator
MKALFIEDDLFLQQAARKMLAKLDIELIVSTDAAVAASLIPGEKVRFIIIDLMVRGLDGIALCRKIRKLRLSRYVYIILLTPDSGKNQSLDALEAGADDYLPKPFDEKELAARIRAGERIIQLETKLLNSQKKLMRLAKEDPLTRVLNRRSLFDEILQELNRASRKNGVISTVCVEIDDFRSMAEKYGVLASDLALIELARRMKACLRKYDRVGRLGGAEFIMLLPETDKNGAMKVAERLKASLTGTPFSLGSAKVNIMTNIAVCPFSFGMDFSGIEVDDRLLDEVVWRCDLALKSARNQSTGKIIVFTPREGPVSRK